MAATQTILVEPGTPAPDFNLPDVISGNNLSFNDVKGINGTLVVFMYNHCPYVLHILNHFIKNAHKFIEQGIGIVAISSNDIVNYPQDSPQNMLDLATQKKFPFPYLYDADQSVAKAYKAACTPDFFLYDKEGKTYYRGRYDETNHKNNLNPHGSDLLNAITSLLNGEKAPEVMHPSLGCNIKWLNNEFPY